MTKRQVFFSFHFDNDAMRAQQVRNIGALEGNTMVSVNDWENIKKGGESEIKRWINTNMQNRSCVVVLVGSNTAKRPWVIYEIEKAWKDGKGLLGIYIHNLTCPRNGRSTQGSNPFDAVTVEDGSPLSKKVKCYNPGLDAYKGIHQNLESWIDEAIKNRAQNLRSF
jgi:hypothetical protein